MTRENIEVNRMCPRIVIEDMLSDLEFDMWQKRAISALESFRMVDPKEEAVRRACEESIRKSLELFPLRVKP